MRRSGSGANCGPGGWDKPQLTPGTDTRGRRRLTENPAERRKPRRGMTFGKWAWVELNYRPHAYQACALTT